MASVTDAKCNALTLSDSLIDVWVSKHDISNVERSMEGQKKKSIVKTVEEITT